ncbi:MULTISPECIES: recombinase family protein [unclassified Shinella]|uniref:recombinase family protein n=1 Tax=unclassified Shinella TaxID=2643062 RepID=UPI00225CE761|nr:MULTISPECIES: recombinase family protein [unclassified Shinella]MCO5138894.1 recombinase family protein [Shinella sp.]MDC7255733.1 recombinase family protein [Shinella sp. YE25]CAI0338550.1 Site-specific recombinase, DNA invertase Pin [Rhizobiaceae bacterium]CAK7256993.1 site-specific DNA recombinase [Shinella sp. WSC3-e]
MVKRVLLYARYSTDQQNPASIETQLDLGKAMIEAKGWQLIDSFVDAGISGANYETRPGLQGALFAAQQHACDVFLCLTLDRLSRDLEHSARILKLLQFHDVELWTVQGGSAVSAIELGIRAVLSQETIEQTRYRTREGMKTVAKGGRIPGGLCYGYRVIKEYDATGNLIRGLRTIDAKEAETVVTIFNEFSKGLTPDAIAAKLNQLGIAGPRGKPWQGTAIRGHRNRGTGILNNELYVGRLIFNRLEYRKNPATERRVSRPNPTEEHVVVEIPDLRIVSGVLWQKVKDRQGANRSRCLSNAPLIRSSV